MVGLGMELFGVVWQEWLCEALHVNLRLGGVWYGRLGVLRYGLLM